MNVIAVKASSKEPRMGLVSGDKYKVMDSHIRADKQFYTIVSNCGRELNITLGEGVIANFKPVYRVGC